MSTTIYRQRVADSYLTDPISVFPAVMINFARSTGKTTTAAQEAAQLGP
jgi:hypothetical protein